MLKEIIAMSHKGVYELVRTTEGVHRHWQQMGVSCQNQSIWHTRQTQGHFTGARIEDEGWTRLHGNISGIVKNRVHTQ